MAKFASLAKALQAADSCMAYCFYGDRENMLYAMADNVLHTLNGLYSDAENTRIDGPLPALEEIIASAGSPSLFGSKRIVYLAMVTVYSMSEDDVNDLCDVIETTDNAIFVLTVPISDDNKKAIGQRKSKKLAQLLAVVEKSGFAQELRVPTKADAIRTVQQIASELCSGFTQGAAALLVQRVGTDEIALRNECEKLAAMANYGTIDEELVQTSSTHNLESDVFRIFDAVKSKNQKVAFLELNRLFAMQYEPIAIAAALSTSYIDITRVRAGLSAGKTKRELMNIYKYSPGRAEHLVSDAEMFSMAQLRESIRILDVLDSSMKRTPVDMKIQLEAALLQLFCVRNT